MAHFGLLHGVACWEVHCSKVFSVYTIITFFPAISRKKCLSVRILFQSALFLATIYFSVFPLADDSRLDPSLNEIPAGFSFCCEFSLVMQRPLPQYRCFLFLFFFAPRCRRRDFCATPYPSPKDGFCRGPAQQRHLLRTQPS